MMKLNWKYTLGIVSLLVVFNLFLWVFSRTMLLESFVEHEEVEMHDHIHRVLSEIEAELQNLTILTYDWGAWDDTYRYMAAGGQDKRYVDLNFHDGFLPDLNLSLAVFIDRAGKVVFGEVFDDGTGKIAPLSADTLAFVLDHEELWQQAKDGLTRQGLMLIAGTPTLVVVQPILRNGGEGPVVGSLVFGRGFDGDEIERLGVRTRLDLKLTPYDSQDVSTTHAATLGSALDFFGDIRRDEGSDKVYGLIRINDLINEPSILLQVSMSRSVYRQGLETIQYFLLWALFASIFVCFVVWLIMNRLLLATYRVRESEKAYKALSLEFKTILDGIQSSVTLISADMRVVWANRSAMGSLGIDQWESGSGRISEGVEDSKVQERNPLVLRAMKEGLFLEELQDKDDGRKVSLKLFPLFDGKGKVKSVIKLEADVTEKMLLRKEVQQAGHMAALGELAAGVAHEINNPNGMILRNLGFVREVLADALPLLDDNVNLDDLQLGGLDYAQVCAELPQLIDDMQHGAGHIRDIVQDMKEFVRPGGFSANAHFDLNDAVATSVRLLAGPLRKMTDNFELCPGEGLPMTVGIAQQVEQVVVNLVLNACHSLPDRSHGITVTTRFEPETHCNIVEVVDQGCGMLKVVVDKITDPFFTTRREQGGTGLGLSMSQRIVEQHGGSLIFESELRRGTRVTLSLPADRSNS